VSTATVDATKQASGRSLLRGMPWVTWRQHRDALAGAVAVLGAFAALMVINGLAMHSAYTKLGLNVCGPPTGAACQVPFTVFTNQYDTWTQFLPRFMEFIPGLLGVFIGAPLVARELESGTFRFAWTQGRSRVRWITAKLALLGVALTVLALGFSAVFGWWFGPYHQIMGRMVGGEAYEVEGIVFAARTLFAFTLGTLLGAIIRKTVPAMAATGAIFIAVAWGSVLYLRPLIMKPVTSLDSPAIGVDDSWTIHAWFQDPTGHHLNAAAVTQLARASGVHTTSGLNTWLAQHHYVQWVSYQPGNRFWHFQTIEASAYLVLALALAAAAVWWIARRAS
jgi:ABC-type transport system involved in multi-copper enzyme maturation permease subunit